MLARPGPNAPVARRWHLLAIWSIILLPLLVKSPLIAGVLIADPAHLYGQLTADAPKSILYGLPTLEPNIAYTSHALGSLSARLAASGQSLWWNPYEGVGMPLAGEMQSAALFPPTWLMLFPKGQLFEHLLFQIIAGLATYFLLRRLQAGVAGAWLAGLVFAFNGVFAWLANAIVNPVCFLPVILLGVEMLGDRTSARRGWLTVAIGVAGALYSGFPEVAYLNGVLIALWTLVRATALGRKGGLVMLSRAIAGALCGVLIAAPVLVAFADFLVAGNVGVHAGGIPRDWFIDPAYAIELLFPYHQEYFYAHDSAFFFWANVGGYAGLAVVVLAVAGCMGPTARPLRLMLVAWVFVTLGVTFGVRPLAAVFGLIPFTSMAALYRYLDSSWIFALCVLAGLAVGDIAASRTSVRALRTGLALALVIGVALAVFAWTKGVKPEGLKASLTICFQLLLLGPVIVAAFGRPWVTPQRRAAMLTGAVAIEAIALFLPPVLHYPYESRLELAGVRYLQSRLGLQRFVTLGPIAANYGSYFGIAQVNHNDLPVPQRWVDHAARHLDRKADPIAFSPNSPSELLRKLPAYAAIGTRFVIAPANQPLTGLTQVFKDRVMRIYDVPGTRPYFSAASCAVVQHGRLDVELTCARPVVLERLELYMEGWSATVNGRATLVAPAGELFQAVQVPAGRSRVHFDFLPPYMAVAYALAAIGVAGLLTGAWLIGRRRMSIEEQR